MKTPKFLFVTGGVLSGIGKGIAAASVGALLRGQGYRVFAQKLDGYLNLDPGTMSPDVHGEVFVTDDGFETDLDLGHYERFLGEPLSRDSSWTAGRLLTELLDRERAGDFGGRDVQMVPDFTGLVVEKIKKAAEKSDADVTIVEIGGTVGDFENEAFFEAARSLRAELGAENVAVAMVAFLPFLKSSGELKSRPTQHAVRKLREYGLSPDLLFVRADKKIPGFLLQKIARMTGVEEKFVVPAPTIRSIYQVPLNFEKVKIGENVARRLGLEPRTPDLENFRALDRARRDATEPLRIALVAKYLKCDDAYFSVTESIRLACWDAGVVPEIVPVDAESLENPDSDAGRAAWENLEKCAGVVVPGGFGNRGIEGKIAAAKFCRETRRPYLGLCLGSQILAIEFARNVAGLAKANSAEFDAESPDPVVCLMDSQKKVTRLGGTMRLGAQPCRIAAGTLAAEIYGGEKIISERHRHRFEFNPKYRADFEKLGLRVSGENPDSGLVEVVELDREKTGHPFMIGSQFHPEFLSRPGAPHPLFAGLVRAAKK